MTKISPAGRQTLGAKANAQKATGTAGKFGHLQNDAPPAGLKPLPTTAGPARVPQLKKEYNPYAAFDTRAEVDAAHQRMTDSIEKSEGIIGDQAEFDAYHQDRRADLEAARTTQMEALEEKLAADNQRVLEANKRSIYFATAANDTQARLALHDVQLHFPTAVSIHLENEDRHNESDAPLNAVRVLDADGNILCNVNDFEIDEDADELMTALSEHSGEMDWDGLRHITGEGEGTFYNVPLALAYEPQPAYLTDLSQIDAPRVPSARSRFLSECDTIEHLEFKMMQVGERGSSEWVQESYEVRLAELRAAGL